MKHIALLCSIILLASCTRPPASPEASPGTKPLHPATPQLTPRTEGKKAVRVYFSDPQLERLVVLDREIYDTEDQTSQVIQTIDLMTIPPNETQEVAALWPPTTFAREVYLLESGTIVVDLDSSFILDAGGGVQRETSMVECMVRTILENFPTFSQVQILVDGHVQETLLGHVDIESPLTAPPIDPTEGEKAEEDEIEVEDLLDQDTQKNQKTQEN